MANIFNSNKYVAQLAIASAKTIYFFDFLLFALSAYKKIMKETQR